MIRMNSLKLVALLVLLIAGACFAGEYTVESGDTLSSIAQKELGSSGRWKEIAELNNLSEPYRIKRGQVLKIPGVSADKEEIQKELTELIESSEKKKRENPFKKLFGGKKVKWIWFLPAAPLVVVILVLLVMLLINTVSLYISSRLMGVKGRFGKCFIIIIAAQGPCFLIQNFFPLSFNPFMTNPWTILAVFYGTIFLFCLVHVFLIKVLLDCKISIATASFCLMISLILFSYLVIYLIFLGVGMGVFAAKFS